MPIPNLPDAPPRPRWAMRPGVTSYAVMATNPAGESAVLGFTRSRTNRALLAVMQGRGEELVKASGLTDAHTFTIKGGSRAVARFAGWMCFISRVTERDLSPNVTAPTAEA